MFPHRTISIHALREEGDAAGVYYADAQWNFYPRPPRGGRRTNRPLHSRRWYFYPRPPRGGRRARWNPLVLIPVFLSTPSARRATLFGCSVHAGFCYFYPRPPRGGRRGRRSRRFPQRDFYPRPPRGGRLGVYYYTNASCEFLSTPSARRATAAFSAWPAGMSISIHALREEGDSYRSIKHRPWTHFYPRPPRGGRPVVVLQHVGFHQFLSTPSARRATLKTTITTNVGGISIHALREEGDRRAFLQGRLPVYFYPRPPRGGRPPVGTRKAACHELFLSTPSARRTTVSVSPEAAVLPNFYPRPPRGGRLPPC